MSSPVLETKASINTTSTLPAEAVQLGRAFDIQRIQAEIAEIPFHFWGKQRIYDAAGLGPPTDLDWRVLPLRSLGGDPDRTDPGGPGQEDFGPTLWLDQLPYLKEILSTIPAPLNAVRLMALGPGTACAEHCDSKYSMSRGFARLHIPILTNPGVTLTLDGVVHRWQPGEFWFGEFARPHKVGNDGTCTRIHLVIDTLMTTDLATLFPTNWYPYLFHGDVLFNRHPIPDTPVADNSITCVATIPSTFTEFNHDDTLNRTGPMGPIHVSTENGQVHLVDNNEKRYLLVHIGREEFRFAAWSEQRTIQLLPGVMTLRVHKNRIVHEIIFPAKTITS